mmetsp:Transcript_34711/g.70883  ORF Transcript_34711/g.70883 Transcript_34711/m.70883 type:complete len:405 (-) Transcript_34711:47-1261(-)
MPDDYSPVRVGSGGNGVVDIASFDLEIASSRQRHGHREGSTSTTGKNLFLWFLFASVAVAGYCIYTGILDLPTGLMGATMDESGADGPSNDDISGLNDDDWEGSSMSSPGYDEQDLNTISEQEQDTLHQQTTHDESQDAEETAVAEPQNNQQQPAADSPRFIFCYGDSLTFGFIPSEGEPHPYGPSLQSELINLYSAASAIKAPELKHPPSMVVRHVGFPGMPASAMLNLVEQKDVGACAIVENIPTLSVLIILTGTNDLQQMAPDIMGPGGPEAIDSNGKAEMILESITNLHKATLECAQRVGNKDMHTLALGIPGSQFQTQFPVASDIAAKVNKGLNEFSSSYNKESPHGKIVYSDFPIAYDKSDSKWGPDGLHLSAEGYDELGKKVAPEVKRILDMMYDDL